MGQWSHAGGGLREKRCTWGMRFGGAAVPGCERKEKKKQIEKQTQANIGHSARMHRGGNLEKKDQAQAGATGKNRDGP